MQVSVVKVVQAFDVLYTSIHDPSFRKTLPFHKMSERQLARHVRMFLLGAFGYQTSPEHRSPLPGSLTGRGSIDFIIGNVAVEFAVRKHDAGTAPLSAVTNATEIKKLLKFDRLSLLVLFDMSNSPLNESAIERYRDWPSLGKGNHKLSAFNVAYFYRDAEGYPRRIEKRIRV